MEINDFEQLRGVVEGLIDSWNERNEQVPLKYLRQGWPLLTGLTDDWWRLIDALKQIRQSHKSNLTDKESRVLDELISMLEDSMYQSRDPIEKE